MTVQRYEIHEAFAYTASLPSGDVVEGSFAAGVTGDLTDEQVAYLESVAVPNGFAARVDDAPVPTSDPEPAPAPEPDPAVPPVPQEPAPVPSDTQEQAQ